MTATTAVTPAGWYTQPDGQQKYWNGSNYTATWTRAGAAYGVPERELSFFSSLFDFSFTSFVTLKILSFVYAVNVIAVILGAAVGIGVVLSRGGPYVILGCVGIPITALIYVIIVRVSLEAIAVFFRIGKNVSRLADQRNS